MANKKITDLQLRSDVEDIVNFPGDDGTQTYRMTAVQLWNYIRLKIDQVAAFTANTAITSDHVNITLDPTSAGFTQDLPDCTTFPHITIGFKNIALPSNGNAVTLDGNGSQLIDDETTLVLNSFPAMDWVRLRNTGTKWVRV